MSLPFQGGAGSGGVLTVRGQRGEECKFIVLYVCFCRTRHKAMAGRWVTMGGDGEEAAEAEVLLTITNERAVTTRLRQRVP